MTLCYWLQNKKIVLKGFCTLQRISDVCNCRSDRQVKTHQDPQNISWKITTVNISWKAHPKEQMPFVDDYRRQTMTAHLFQPQNDFYKFSLNPYQSLSQLRPLYFFKCGFLVLYTPLNNHCRIIRLIPKNRWNLCRQSRSKERI